MEDKYFIYYKEWDHDYDFWEYANCVIDTTPWEWIDQMSSKEGRDMIIINWWKI